MAVARVDGAVSVQSDPRFRPSSRPRVGLPRRVPPRQPPESGRVGVRSRPQPQPRGAERHRRPGEEPARRKHDVRRRGEQGTGFGSAGRPRRAFIRTDPVRTRTAKQESRNTDPRHDWTRHLTWGPNARGLDPRARTPGFVDRPKRSEIVVATRVGFDPDIILFAVRNQAHSPVRRHHTSSPSVRPAAGRRVVRIDSS